jgi:hypothetical protein
MLPLLNPHYNYSLFLLLLGLVDQHLTLADYQLPTYIYNWSHVQGASIYKYNLMQEKSLVEEMLSQLNADQSACFNAIIAAIIEDPQSTHFYLQGLGGTRKTFVYKTICYYYRGIGKTVLCVASTRIAALLLPSGRTSHLQFKIPLKFYKDSTYSITKNSQFADLLHKVDLII